MATGVDQRWLLQVDGQPIAPRPAFGTTTGYDIASGGPATLRYHTATSRSFALIGQLLLWLLLALGVSRFDTGSLVRWRRGGASTPARCAAAVDRCADRRRRPSRDDARGRLVADGRRGRVVAGARTIAPTRPDRTSPARAHPCGSNDRLRRLVAGLMVIASIVGCRDVAAVATRATPHPPSSPDSAGADDAVRPQGLVRDVGVVLRRGADRRRRSWVASPIVANPIRSRRSSGKITTFTDAPMSPRSRQPFEVPARGTMQFDLASGTTAGHVRLGDGRDRRRRRVRRAARRQRIGQRGVTVLQRDVVDVVLRRRLHRRGQQRSNRRHQPVPVRRDRQHQRIDHAPRACATRRILQGLLVPGQLGAGDQLRICSPSDELVLAITVTSTRGRVVVGRGAAVLAAGGRPGSR